MSNLEESLFPGLAGLFLTHFDDIKGQSVIFWRGRKGMPKGHIVHQED